MVSYGDLPRAINSNCTLVKLMYLNDSTSFVPSFGEVSNSFMYGDMVANLKGVELLSMFLPFFLSTHVAVLEGVLCRKLMFPPSWCGLVLSR